MPESMNLRRVCAKKLKRGDMTASAYAQQMASAIIQGGMNSPGHGIYQCIDIHAMILVI